LRTRIVGRIYGHSVLADPREIAALLNTHTSRLLPASSIPTGQEPVVETVSIGMLSLSSPGIRFSMESGLRATTAYLENRQRRFGVRLLRLPQGDQAREVVGAPSEIGRGLTKALANAGRTESTVLLEEPETLNAVLVQQEEEEAKVEAEMARPGLTMFTDGSRTEDVAAGYVAAWKRGESGLASKPTWGTTRRPTMRSAPHLPARWSRLREETLSPNGSQSSRTRKRP